MTNDVTWKCQVYDSAKGRYDIILGRYLLTEVGINLKLSDNSVKAENGTLKGSTTPMADLGTYIFKYLNIGKIKPEE